MKSMTRLQPFSLGLVSLCSLAIAAMLLLSSSGPQAAQAGSVGETSIARWKDGMRGALTMNFDDSMVSQADRAIPAMNARGLRGTFYINPGNEWTYGQRPEVWETQTYPHGHDLANHTWSHEGADTYAQAEQEIGDTAQFIVDLRPPDMKSPLMSFAWPGGTSWNLSETEKQTLLSKYNAADRIADHGYHNCVEGTSAGEMYAYAQSALARGTWEVICFHGIGGEWISVDLQQFTTFLDQLVEVKDELWIAPHLPVHKYAREREGASVTVLETDESRIRLSLTSTTDELVSGTGAALYDEPLTLITQVPAGWTEVQVQQAGQVRAYAVAEGRVTYEARPGAGEILLLAQTHEPTSFEDVPTTHPYYQQIEALYQAGYTAGCGTEPPLYCPDATMTRAEGAVFTMRGAHGAHFEPQPPLSLVFADVPLQEWYADWVGALWEDGFTAGCSAEPPLFCPERGYTRAEGAVFALRMKHRGDYLPPDPAGLFTDVPPDAWYADWVEAAYHENLIEPCDLEPLSFCPSDPLTRGLGAYMIYQAKEMGLH